MKPIPFPTTHGGGISMSEMGYHKWYMLSDSVGYMDRTPGYVMRVPGGFIYEVKRDVTAGTHLFVPFVDESITVFEMEG